MSFALVREARAHMTTRHELPGGQWAELLDPDDLSGADQDGFLDRYDELMQEQPQPAPQPDPANPAVMLAAPPRTLGRAGNRALEDWIFALLIAGWSFDLPLPWQGEHREAKGQDGKPVLSVRTINALRKASRPAQDALTDTEDDDDGADGAPKSEPASGSGGSPDTSAASSGSLLPAPPAVTSGTP